MADDLSTTETYLLAQILVSGNLTYQEICDMNDMLSEVRDDALLTLQKKGYLEHTMTGKVR